MYVKLKLLKLLMTKINHSCIVLAQGYLKTCILLYLFFCLIINLKAFQNVLRVFYFQCHHLHGFLGAMCFIFFKF